MVIEVSPETVKSKIETGDVQVIDIRPTEQFEAGHIPSAINVPFHELVSRISEINWGDEIIVACPIGQSSIQAARLIQSYEGVRPEATVASMAGGYEAWQYELSTSSET